MKYSQKTHELIERMRRNVERKSFRLNKKKAEECILKTYDIFGLDRPKKIIWYKDIFNEDYNIYTMSAMSAGSAGSVWSAGSARSARSAGSAGSAWSAWSAGSAGSAGSVWSAGSARSARHALDYDFDYYIIEHEYIHNRKDNPGNEPNENDYKYLEYSELLLQAKEYGLGYRIEYKDTLHLVPTPLVEIDEQNKFHSVTKPAIRWKGGKSFYFLHGTEFDKDLWIKIVNKEISAVEVLKLDNIEQRYIALKMSGAEKLLNELNAKKIDGKTEMGNELYEIEGVLPNKLKLLKYECPSTGRVYTKFVPEKFNKADEAQAWSHHFTLSEYKTLKAQS